MRDLTDEEESTLRAGHCLFCGGTGFYEGPAGGMSVNIECAGCGARYNFNGITTTQLIRDPT